MSEPVLKILIIGPSNAGKSALLKRYCDDDFDLNDASATIGIDFRVKRLSVRGTTYRLTLLDTAGQERFRTLSTSFYRGAHGVVFVYDLTNRATFEQMPSYFAEAEAHVVLGRRGDDAGGPSSAPACQFCVVGAKLDRAGGGRAVAAEEGAALAARLYEGGSDAGAGGGGGPLFFETSARTGQNVREPFVALVDRIVAAGTAAAAASSRAGAAGTVSLGGGGYTPSCAC